MTKMLRRFDWHNSTRRLVRETDGQEIAEAAAVLPLMFMVLLGIFWFGQAFSIYGTAARAAHEAALAAAESNCTTCASGSSPEQNANNTIKNILATANLSISNVQPGPAPISLSCQGTPATCDTTYGFCFQGNVQLSSTAAGAVPDCGVSVSFVYQYQFWLPFTSLNKQAIKIRAAAQAPLESR